MGCVFLASKTEEQPRKMREIINVFDYLRQRRVAAAFEPMELFSQVRASSVGGWC
jgi:hypothetical protein